MSVEPMPRVTARWLVDYAAELPNEEVCGFVLRDWKIEPVVNRADNPASRFSLDEAHLIRIMATKRAEVVGVFHSHPQGNPHPSDDDCTRWPYPQFRYWIIASSDVYEWEIRDGLAKPVDRAGKTGPSGLAHPVLASPEAL